MSGVLRSLYQLFSAITIASYQLLEKPKKWKKWIYYYR